MRIFLNFYFTICIVLVIFNITFIIYNKLKANRYYETRVTKQGELKKHLDTYLETGEVSKYLENYLTKKIKKTNKLLVLNNLMENEPKVKALAQPYIWKYLNHYLSKNEYEKAFFAYVVSKLDYQNYEVANQQLLKFLTLLNSNSIYTFTNAMNTLYQMGNGSLMLIGVNKVNERNNFYNHKMLVDGLVAYQGDHLELASKLQTNFKNYQSNIKIAIIDYFRIKDIDSSDFFTVVLKTTKDNEVKYALARYFTKHPSDEVNDFFIEELIKSNNWLDELQAIKVLNNYQDLKISKQIFKKVNSRNWHVRRAAIKYFYEHQRKVEDLYPLIDLQDRYVDDLVLYFVQDDSNYYQVLSDRIDAYS